MDIHIARSGETLYTVARRYAVECGELARVNQLDDPGRLTAGLALLIPGRRELPRRSIELLGREGPCVCRSVVNGIMPRLTFFCPSDDNAELSGGENASHAAAAHALPLLTVSNLSAQGAYSSSNAHVLLGEDAVQTALLENICARIREERWGGILADIQYIYPFDRGAYGAFLQRAAEALHPLGAYLFAVAAPKKSADESSLTVGAHDYAAMGVCCDRVLLQCSDRDCREELHGALEYALTELPAEKLLLDISPRACMSTSSSAAERISVATAVNMAVSTGAEIKYDPLTHRAYFTCTDALSQRRTVSFDDVRTARDRLHLADEYALAGISLWCVNAMHQPTLRLLETLFSAEQVI